MRKYALNLAEGNRILSACIVLPNGNYEGMPVVDTIPEGNIPDYRYENNEYIYDPLPAEEVVTLPTIEDRVSALENRIDLCEQAYVEGVNNA